MADPHHSLSLEMLAEKAQQGDARALNELLKQCVTLSYKILAGKLKNPEWADDIVQDILISVHKALHTYDPSKPFVPWLKQISYYRLQDFLRQYYKKRDKEAFFLQEHVTNPAHRGELKDIEKHLSILPARLKRMVIAFKVEGYTAKEIAEQEDMKESAVKVAIHRALKKLVKYSD